MKDSSVREPPRMLPVSRAECLPDGPGWSRLSRSVMFSRALHDWQNRGCSAGLAIALHAGPSQVLHVPTACTSVTEMFYRDDGQRRTGDQPVEPFSQWLQGWKCKQITDDGGYEHAPDYLRSQVTVFINVLYHRCGGDTNSEFTEFRVQNAKSEPKACPEMQCKL